MYSPRSEYYLLILNLVSASVFTGLRCYVRLFSVKKFWVDDWLAAVAPFIQAVATAPYIHALYLAGYQAHPVPVPSTTELRLRDEWLSMLLYTVAIGVIKVSFGFTLLRFMVETVQIVIVQILIVVIIAMTIAFFFVTVFTCAPVSYFWTRATDPYAIAVFLGDPNPGAAGLVPRGNCLPSDTYGAPAMYSQIGLTIVVDVLLGLVMPFLMLHKIRMRRDLKITAFALLSLGAIPSIASINRLVYAHTFTAPDALNSAAPLFVWSNVELAWCQIGPALTTLRPLANKLGLFRDSSTRGAHAVAGAADDEDGSPRPWFGPESRNWRRRRNALAVVEINKGTTATVWAGDAAAAINGVGHTRAQTAAADDDGESTIGIVYWRGPDDRNPSTSTAGGSTAKTEKDL